MTAVCSYFRASAVRTKELHEIVTEAGVTAKQFPCEFEVRFAQHLEKITWAVLHNRPSMLAYSTKVTSTCSSAQRAEAGQAQGFLNMWQDDYNVRMLCLLTEILVVFRRLEKTIQKHGVLIPNVCSARKAAVAKLETMADAAIPNGNEMHYLQDMQCDLTDVSDLLKKWKEGKKKWY